MWLDEIGDTGSVANYQLDKEKLNWIMEVFPQLTHGKETIIQINCYECLTKCKPNKFETLDQLQYK